MGVFRFGNYTYTLGFFLSLTAAAVPTTSADDDIDDDTGTAAASPDNSDIDATTTTSAGDENVDPVATYSPMVPVAANTDAPQVKDTPQVNTVYQ